MVAKGLMNYLCLCLYICAIFITITSCKIFTEVVAQMTSQMAEFKSLFLQQHFITLIDSPPRYSLRDRTQQV